MQLLPDEFERLAPYFEVASSISRARRAGIRKAINGPFTFAPDGNPLVGPVRGCAITGGLRRDGGIQPGGASAWCCRAGWRGRSGQDILSMDVARFGRFATPKYTSVKCREFTAAGSVSRIPMKSCRRRPVRRSPVYDRLLDAGAVMGANFGLEHALWLRRRASHQPRRRRTDAPSLPIVREECRAVRRAAGLYETSNYGKYEITGRGARAWLDKVFACRIPQPDASAWRRC